MQREYCAFCMDHLRPILDELEMTSKKIKDAKKQRNYKSADRLDEDRMKLAEKAVINEAHMSFMWFWSRKEYTDKKSRQAGKNGQKRQADKESGILSEAANALREVWMKHDWIGEIPSSFRFVPDESAIISLPPLSFILRIPFTLRKPYLSRDDNGFYIIDNPIRREWVFRKPYIAPTQWKGAMRLAIMRQLLDQLGSTGDETAFIQKRLHLYRLFGSEQEGVAGYLNRVMALQRVGAPPKKGSNEKQEEEWRSRFEEESRRVAKEFDETLREEGYRIGDVEGFQGRLHFYPTFFDKIGLEVINPHDRKSGAGSQPIYFECVPPGTRGTLTLLYVHFNAIGQAEAARRQEAADDLKMLAEGIYAMLVLYGFGAKTSSGYGVAEEKLAGTGMCAIRAVWPGMMEPTLLQEPLPVVKKTFEDLCEMQSVVEQVADALRKEEKA